MFIFHCDRCGVDVPSYTNRLEYCNCGPCESEYQVNLWRRSYCEPLGWTDESVREWEKMFEEQEGQTYQEYRKGYDAYRAYPEG